MMKLYDAFRPLNMETNALGVGLRAILLQVKEGMNCGCDEVQECAPNCFCQLRPIA